MKSWSLRRKLQVLTGSVVAVALLLFGIATAVNLYYEQIEALDQQLAREARPLLEQIADAPDPVHWLKSEESREILAMLPHHFMVVRDPSGRVLHASRALRKHELPNIRDGGFRTVRIGDVPSRVGVFEKDGFHLALAFDLDEVEDVVGDLMLAYLFALPLAVLAAAFGSWWITEKALAPIKAIATTAEEITAQKLDTRLPEPETGDEIARLTHILNRMFDRLERAFRSASRFSADASHELNTPLTIIRGRIEEALLAENTDTEPLLVDLLEETSRLSGITENLLLLARADAWQLDLDLREVDLTQLVEETLEDAGILASGKEITLERTLQPGVILQGDAGRLRQVLLNLLDNAVKYAEPGGRITVTLEGDEQSCVCAVANTGSPIPADKAGQIFDRFYRGDASRGVERGHGLGLSICLELVHAHGGTIELAENRPGHIEFRIHLPVRQNCGVD